MKKLILLHCKVSQTNLTCSKSFFFSLILRENIAVCLQMFCSARKFVWTLLYTKPKRKQIKFARDIHHPLFPSFKNYAHTSRKRLGEPHSSYGRVCDCVREFIVCLADGKSYIRHYNVCVCV